MTSYSLAGVITSIATLITALGLFVGAIPALVKLIRKTEQVHIIVNSQKTAMEEFIADKESEARDRDRYINALVLAMRHAGIDVPIDQSNDSKSS